MAPFRLPSEKCVFLNVPYDHRYERRFVALVTALVSLGLRPCCVFEIQERGTGRLERVFQMLEHCRYSIHDMCRAGPEPRFNMPFELGLAFALNRYGTGHDIYIVDEQPHRLAKHLSDLQGVDAGVYDGKNKVRALVSRILSLIGTSEADPKAADVYEAYRTVYECVPDLKKDNGTTRLYDRKTFRELIAAATLTAKDRGFIRE